MDILSLADALKIVLIGIIEGITEWLPVSSTGHMLIFDAIAPFEAEEAFKEMFFVVIQLGAILAVVTCFWRKMLPVTRQTVLTPEGGEKKSGLSIASRILRGIDGIGIFEFSERDVVRHSLVRKIINAYDKYEREYETKKYRAEKKEDSKK